MARWPSSCLEACHRSWRQADRYVAPLPECCDHVLMRKRGAPPGIVVPVLLALATLFTACGASDVKYLKNSKAGLYLKVPRAWAVFPLQEGHPMELGTKPVTNGSSVVNDKPTPWIVGFDGAEQPSRSDFDASIPPQPLGVVQVVPTEYLQNFSPSVTALRSLLTGESNSSSSTIGALSPPLPSVDEFEQLERPTGHWGVRMVLTEEKIDGTLRLQKLAFVDRTAERLYVLTIGCSASCFDRNRAAIDRVAASFTLEQR